MLISASAPGSLMLLGEYAVLDGKPALVCAMDKRITVTLQPRSDERITIQSTLHGQYATDLVQLKIVKPFQFVLGALKQLQPKLKRGCDIHITSNFSDQIGLGSSAAVTVATLAALISWLKINTSPLDLVRQGCAVVREVQGVGSGADIAASVYGGMVAYRAEPLAIEHFALTHPLTVWYAGFKTPTVDAIKQVRDQFANLPQLLSAIQHSIGHCALLGIQAVRKQDWTTLGKLMDIQQGMMEALGVSTLSLHAMVTELRQQPNVLGAKISGAGFGDCVIAWGTMAANLIAKHHPGVQCIPTTMTTCGVQCEKN